MLLNENLEKWLCMPLVQRGLAGLLEAVCSVIKLVLASTLSLPAFGTWQCQVRSQCLDAALLCERFGTRKTVGLCCNNLLVGLTSRSQAPRDIIQMSHQNLACVFLFFFVTQIVSSAEVQRLSSARHAHALFFSHPLPFVSISQPPPPHPLPSDVEALWEPF